MLLKFKNSFKGITQPIENKVQGTQDFVKNTILSIFLITGIGITTKTEANIQLTENKKISQIEKGVNTKNTLNANSIKLKKIKKELTLEQRLNKITKNTLLYAQNKKNPLFIDDNKQIEILSRIIQNTELTINKLKNEEISKMIINNKIKILKVYVKYNKNISNDCSIEELFDYYTTLERINFSQKYFKKIDFDNFYNNHISKNYGGDLNKGVKEITKNLYIEKNIIHYNENLKNKINDLRKQSIDQLLDIISVAEDTYGNYNAILSNGEQNKVKYTEMTIKGVLHDMKIRQKTKGGSATGKYQVIHKTLKEFIEKNNIDINKQKFSANFQEKIAIIKLKERGLHEYITGKISRDEFQKNLSMEWASLPKDKSEKSFHEYDGVNKAYCSNNDLVQVLDNVKNPKPHNSEILILAIR